MSKRLEKLKRVEEAKAPEDRLVNRHEVQKAIGILNAIRQRRASQISILQSIIEISQDAEPIRLLDIECEVTDQRVREFGSLGSSTASEHAAIRRQNQ